MLHFIPYVYMARKTESPLARGPTIVDPIGGNTA